MSFLSLITRVRIKKALLLSLVVWWLSHDFKSFVFRITNPLNCLFGSLNVQILLLSGGVLLLHYFSLSQ